MTRFALLLLALLLPAAVLAGCTAQVSLNTTTPGSTFIVYYDVVVENTGSCDILDVFVEITLPPGDIATFYNISNTTGQLEGLPPSVPQGSAEIGGYLSLESARTPLLTIKSVQCAADCPADTPTQAPTSAPTSAPTTVPSSAPTEAPTTAPTTTPTSGAPLPPHRHTVAPFPTDPTDPPTDPTDAPTAANMQIKLREGSDEYWFALNVLYGGQAVEPSSVWYADSENQTWWNMNVEQWDAPTYFFSPHGPAVLPLSLILYFPNGDFVELDDIITSFDEGVIDTDVTYNPASF